MFAVMGLHYGMRPWDVGRLTLPQIEAYLRRLPDALEAHAGITGQAQAAMLAQLMGVKG